jgi:voltage-gated potassium channel
MPAIARPNLVERSTSRFLREPPSVRTAANVIVWVGMWWALQTVTTVGDGDVTPKNPSGRTIAAFVMLQGIAFVTIVIAPITSPFVARAAEERGIAEGGDEDAAELRVERRLDDIDRRLDRLEELLRK